MLVTYPYRNNLSAYVAGFVDVEGSGTRDGLPQCRWRTSRPYHSAGGRDKIRPARAIRPRFRYKNRPAHPSSLHVRYKTRPARSKWPVLASFVRAGRTLYRFGHQQPEQGELCTAYKVDAEPVDTTAHQVPPVWRVPEGPKGQTAVPVSGGCAWPGFETPAAAGVEGAG